MNYICCQLLSLIKEEYTTNEIIEELDQNEDVISTYIRHQELKPEDIFDEKDLVDWTNSHLFIWGDNKDFNIKPSDLFETKE